MAYVGAVVLFIMGVVMMLPASSASVNPDAHFVFFLPFILAAKLLSLIIYPLKLLVTALMVGWVCELLLFGGLGMHALLTFHKHVNNREGFLKVAMFLWYSLRETLCVFEQEMLAGSDSNLWQFLVRAVIPGSLGCRRAYVRPEYLAQDLHAAQSKDSTFRPTLEMC